MAGGFYPPICKSTRRFGGQAGGWLIHCEQCRESVQPLAVSSIGGAESEQSLLSDRSALGVMSSIDEVIVNISHMRAWSSEYIHLLTIMNVLKSRGHDVLYPPLSITDDGPDLAVHIHQVTTVFLIFKKMNVNISMA